jgi:small subunit ribosomal protein S16
MGLPASPRANARRNRGHEGNRLAVKLRLTRVGSKKNPVYRIVAADSRSPRDGKFLEIVGRYNPQTDPSTIDFDEERIRHWLSKGAQPSNTVQRLLKAKEFSG